VSRRWTGRWRPYRSKAAQIAANSGRDAIEGLADDCVITPLHNGGKPPKLIFGVGAFNKIGSLSGKHIQSKQSTFLGDSH